jgi:aminopeptidase N
MERPEITMRFVVFRNFVIVTIFSASLLFSQERQMSGADLCSLKRIKQYGEFMKELSPNTPQHSFDVLKYTLFLDIDSCFLFPYPKSYTATNTITFKVDSALNVIQLNAVNASLIIDSVSLPAKTFSHAADILTITFDSTYHPNDTASVKIYYRHNNIADGAFYTFNGMVFTDCEPEGARKWFPCWDHPSDKAAFDLTAKVPATVKLGSNGRLADSTKIADTIYYHWISRDPIATYLMVMTGKVEYNLDKEYWKKPSNPNESIPVLFYWNNGEDTSSLKNIEAIILPMATQYSRLFGEYPFEKIGFATIAPGAGFIWGGMENQTLISLEPNSWNEDLVSHEFAHHWFGDMISPGTWADVWLNEGFATYCEALWDEYTGGYPAYKNTILSDASQYLSGNPGWPIYDPQWAVTTPGVYTMFNVAITYDKGSCVLHMLRYVLGDSLFFASIKGYAADSINFRLKNAITDDFIQKMCDVSGQDLHWFFNEWLKAPNHPVYQNTSSIDPATRTVNVVMNQTQTNAPFFIMPVELKFSFDSGLDTTIRVNDTTNNQKFSFTFSRNPTAVVFDPDNDIVLKEGGALVSVRSPAAVLHPLSYRLEQNYPNPFNPATRFEFSIADARLVTLKIYDVIGKEVATLANATMNPGTYAIPWDASKLPSGTYFYRLQAGRFVQTKKMTLLK